MPNFKVFSNSADLLTTVANSTAASLLAEVSNSTAASLLTQVSNSTAASLLTQVSNSTAASLLAEVSNSTAASLLTQVSNSTAASLLTQVSNSTAASLLTQVSNSTAASLLTQSTLQNRATQDANVDVADTGTTTLKDTTVRNVLEYTQVTFTVRNTGTSNTAVARLMLSADSVLFSIDPSVTAQNIAPTDQFFFVPGRFTKYAMVQYSSLTASLTTSLSIIFQAHV